MLHIVTICWYIYDTDSGAQGCVVVDVFIMATSQGVCVNSEQTSIINMIITPTNKSCSRDVCVMYRPSLTTGIDAVVLDCGVMAWLLMFSPRYVTRCIP